MPNIDPQAVTRAVKLVRKLEHEITRAGRTVDPVELVAIKQAADALRDHLLAVQASAR